MTPTETLAIQAQNGSERAFSELFDRLYSLAYQRAYKHLQCHEDAQDATSESFIKAWHRLEKWKPKRSTFEKWFFAIVKNTTIDAWRVRERRQKPLYWHSESVDSKEDVLKTIPDTRYTPLDTMVIDESITRIEAALAEIPTEHRNHRLAWVLKHFEEYSYKEIVRILQRPETTCKMWVFRCNEYLKQTLTA